MLKFNTVYTIAPKYQYAYYLIRTLYDKLGTIWHMLLCICIPFFVNLNWKLYVKNGKV